MAILGSGLSRKKLVQCRCDLERDHGTLAPFLVLESFHSYLLYQAFWFWCAASPQAPRSWDHRLEIPKLWAKTNNKQTNNRTPSPIEAAYPRVLVTGTGSRRTPVCVPLSAFHALHSPDLSHV